MPHIEPTFFLAADGSRLQGVWREPDAGTAGHCWVFCAPFAEEEKSAHRTLVELADALVARGDACLFYAYRGTGDSDGDFEDATLAQWREDIAAAATAVRVRYPQSTLGLLGLRLGASLAAQLADEVHAQKLILIEPILRGRSFVAQLGARKKLRAMVTAEEAGEVRGADAAPAKQNSRFEDIDGWALSNALKEELRGLDLSSQVAHIEAEVLLLQIGPREQLVPPLQQFADGIGGNTSTRAVVLPPFWNRLDHIEAAPLIDAVLEFLPAEATGTSKATSTPALTPPDERTHAFTLSNLSGQKLVAIHHQTKAVPRATIVMLHGWTGYRTGPHQMLARAARHLAEAEYSVLRFDFAGRGDSEGDAAVTTLATMADDTRAALEWTRQNQPDIPIILLGLCSGCEVAFAVADEPGVAGLVFWSAPVFAAEQSDERLTRKRARHLKDYAQKLMRPATWAKVLSGRVDIKGVKKVMQQGGGEEYKNVESGDLGQLPSGWRAAAMSRMQKVQMPCLLIYGTADPTTGEALAWHRGQMQTPLQVHYVQGANHSYYGLDWEQEVFVVTEKWLAKSAEPRAGASPEGS